MKIRNMAELYVLYDTPQPGIKLDSPELLLMNYIAEGRTDKAVSLFNEKRQFSDTLPVVDAPYGLSLIHI